MRQYKLNFDSKDKLVPSVSSLTLAIVLEAYNEEEAINICINEILDNPHNWVLKEKCELYNQNKHKIRLKQ